MTVESIKTRQKVEQLMQPGGPAAMIDFWAGWCAPCRALAPHFQAAAEAMSGEPVEFYKVDTEAHPDISAAFNVRSLPTIVLVHDGQIVDVMIGARDANSLLKAAQKLASKARGEGFFQRLFGR
jgi:thioredoxin 1